MHHRPMHRALVTLLCLALSACAFEPRTTLGPTPAPTAEATPGTVASVRPEPAPTATPEAPGLARLEPAHGTYFGMNLDWGNDSVAAVSERLGRTPSVWVQFVEFPLTTDGRRHLDDFVDQVAEVGGKALVTLEPLDGLAAVTDQAIDELVDLLAAYGARDVQTFVRFAHEMNGSWYAWSQQPAEYIDAFRRMAAAVHARSPHSAMVWAPNYGAGYPFGGGAYEAQPGTDAFAALDTDGDGTLTEADDPYAPYYPGDDVVDWVGMSLYHWGNTYPWGANEVAEDGKFIAHLTGTYHGLNGDETAVPDFYAEYVVARDKPLAIVETAALFDPDAPGPPEAQIKGEWWRQVFDDTIHDDFPRIRMINWFEWRKHEVEVGGELDWRISADPALGAELLSEVRSGWLIFAEDLAAR
jgi:hypothetical protein